MFDYQRVTTVSKKLEALSQGACQTRSRLHDLVGNTPLRARPWFEQIRGHPFSAFTQKPNLLKLKGRSWMILPICLSGFTNSWHILRFQPVQRSMNIHGICCRNAGIPGPCLLIPGNQGASHPPKPEPKRFRGCLVIKPFIKVFPLT
jgi:hypothetical protein